MAHGIEFTAIRLIVGTLAVLAQLYLFVHIRRAIKSLPLSGRFKSGAVALVGLAIVLLFAANRYIMLNPLTWAGSPKLAEEVLVYASAVWTFGSIPSALVLFLIHFAGWFRRLARSLFGSDPKMSASDPKMSASAAAMNPLSPILPAAVFFRPG